MLSGTGTATLTLAVGPCWKHREVALSWSASALPNDQAAPWHRPYCPPPVTAQGSVCLSFTCPHLCLSQQVTGLHGEAGQRPKHLDQVGGRMTMPRQQEEGAEHSGAPALCQGL